MSEIAARALLHPSEHLKAALDVLIAAPSSPGRESDTYDPRQRDGDENKRVLAVVSHKDDNGIFEEGSVFLCRPREKDGGLLQLEIQCVYPITEDFSINVAQTKQENIDLNVPPNSGHGPSFSLTIHPGPSLKPEIEHNPLTLYTNANQELRIFLAECKNLTESHGETTIYLHKSEFNTSPEGNSDDLEFESRFQWLTPYAGHLLFSKAFGPVPQDLRIANQPLHVKLSSAAAGLPGNVLEDIQLIRDQYIRNEARKSAFRGRLRLKVRLGTFNVNGKLPSQDLSSWVRGEAADFKEIPPLQAISPLSLGEVIRDPFQAIDVTSDSNPFGFTSRTEDTPAQSVTTDGHAKTENPNPVTSDSDPDILVLGFQEIDLSTEALIYSVGPAREDAWSLATYAALGEKGAHYEKLASKQLVGMLIIIFVKKTLATCFTDVRTSAAGAGIMGLMGNKGGTAVRVTFTPPNSGEAGVASPGPTIFTFVNAHLAAFDEMFEKRNSDFQDLSKRLKFDAEVANRTGIISPPITIYESDVLFWMGDLNYRVDLPDGDVRRILSSERWEGRLEALLRYDQLKKAIRNGTAFVGFDEHQISHLPTYRFSHGMVTDDLGYDIKRKPAWTDRILYMNTHAVDVQQLSYTSHPLITMSDHRPLAADFLLDTDLFDRERRNAMALKIYRSVSDIENPSHRSSLKLDSTIVDFGKISYRAVSQRIRLHNTGQGPCAYRFVPISLNSDTHPDWLHIEPKQAILLPGDSGHITFTASVNNETASRLNLAPKNLDATLILHTMLGKDHFISITGEYQYTCFSNKLSRLIRLPGPIRSLTSPDDLRPGDHPINAPRELMRLVNWMMSQHGNVEGLFTTSADESIVDTIRECLDTGEDFPFLPNDANTDISLAFAATLVRFLESLVDSVVPNGLHARCAQTTSRDEAFEVLDEFPPVSVNVWISITAFLHFICQASDTSQPSEKAEQIATIFTPILLRDVPDSPFPPVSPLGKRAFVMYFIS